MIRFDEHEKLKPG